MKIKEVKLSGIKRSYRRLEDSILGQDMGWWFCDRAYCLEVIRGAGSVQEVLGYGRDLLHWVGYNVEDFDFGSYEKVEAWVNRWSAACDACGA